MKQGMPVYYMDIGRQNKIYVLENKMVSKNVLYINMQ